MTKYNERPVNRMYARAHTITFNFPHETEGLPPSVHFYEHNVIEDAEGVEYPLPETISQADLDVPPETFGTLFNLRDMASEEEIPGATASYGEVANMLYSLYFHVANLRDERLAAQFLEEMPEVMEGLDAGMGEMRGPDDV